MKYNRHQEAIPQAVLHQTNMEISATKAQVRPYGVALTPQERRSLLKMGGKSLAFMEKTHENPHIVTGFLSSVHGLSYPFFYARVQISTHPSANLPRPSCDRILADSNVTASPLSTFIVATSNFHSGHYKLS
jgi:hypothetical protein